MENLKVTYRGIEVPEGFGDFVRYDGFADFKAGVDAALDIGDAVQSAFRRLEVAVLGEPKTPRQWHRTEDIPADVKAVKDSEGWTSVRVPNGWCWVDNGAGIRWSVGDADFVVFDDVSFPVTMNTGEIRKRYGTGWLWTYEPNGGMSTWLPEHEFPVTEVIE